MSYLGSSGGGASLNTTLVGATVGGAPLFVQPATLQLKEDYVRLTYSDGSDGHNIGLGVGPVSSPSGTFTGGYANLQGVLHVEDPGASLAGSTTIYLSSHTRAPLLAIQNGLSYVANVTGALVKLGINSRNYELAPGTYADDFVLTSSTPSSRFRMGKFSTGAGPLVTIPLNTGSSFVGIGQDNPQATLHAGCGTDLPVSNKTQIFGSSYGDAVLAVRDSTNHIETAMGLLVGVPFIGTMTANDLSLRLNNTNRGIFTQTGNAFFGSTTPASYNPESNVLGLTGFPSAAISIAGNQTANLGSVGQVAWYNDAAGLGTRVAAVQVSQGGVNNTAVFNVLTMISGTLGSRIYVDPSGNVGLNQSSPQGALDVVSSLSGLIVPRLGADPTGVNGMAYYNTANSAFRGFQNGAWNSLLTSNSGINGQVQFWNNGSLAGTTNFVWDTVNNTLLLGSPPLSNYFLDVRGTSDGICCYNNFVAGFGTTTFDENRVDLFNSAGTASWRMVGLGQFAPNGLTYGDVQFSRSGLINRALSVPSDTPNVPVAYMTGMSMGVMTASLGSTLTVGGSVAVGREFGLTPNFTGSTNSLIVQGGIHSGKNLSVGGNIISYTAPGNNGGTVACKYLSGVQDWTFLDQRIHVTAPMYFDYYGVVIAPTVGTNGLPSMTSAGVYSGSLAQGMWNIVDTVQNASYYQASAFNLASTVTSTSLNTFVGFESATVHLQPVRLESTTGYYAYLSQVHVGGSLTLGTTSPIAAQGGRISGLKVDTALTQQGVFGIGSLITSAGIYVTPSIVTSTAPASAVGLCNTGILVMPSFSNNITTNGISAVNAGIIVQGIQDSSTVAGNDYGLFVDMTGITSTFVSKYAAAFKGGNVGVGNLTPRAALHGSSSTIVGVNKAANSSGDLNAGECNIWVNEGSNTLTFQVKYSNGATIKSGTVSLS